MADYLNFGIEDAETVPDNDWVYTGDSSTSGTAYPYDETQTRFGATSSTPPTYDPNTRSDGHICRVYDGNQYYYWWEVDAGTQLVDFIPTNIAVESEGGNFTTFNPDCVVLEEADGSKEIVYGRMPTIDITDIYYDEDSDYVRVRIALDRNWDYGDFTGYVEINDSTPDANATSFSTDSEWIYLYINNARATYGTGTFTVYTRIKYDTVYSNTDSGSVTLTEPIVLEWVFIQEHTSTITADIYVNYPVTSYQDAGYYLESEYPAENESEGTIGSVDDGNGTIYEFEVQQV